MALTAQLNEQQLKQNIDAMVQQNAPHDAIQSYINNYQKSSDGNYILKGTQPNVVQSTPESQGAVKQADGTYRGPTFLEGLKESAIGAGNTAASHAIDLGKTALKFGADILTPPTQEEMARGMHPGVAPNPNVNKGAINTLNEAIKTGSDLQKQMKPQNQAQKGGAIAENVAEVLLPLAKPVSQLIENAPKILSSGKGLVGKLLGNKDDVSIIQDMISPKPTVKEARLAQSQGRLIKGNTPTLLKSGTEDVVLPSQKTVRATKTILDTIPDAAKMDETQLYGALNDKTTEIAQNLKPEMQAVPVKPETLDSVGKAWNDLKDVQIQSAPATEEANVTKLQSKFQSILDKFGKIENPTMDDVWSARQAYDQSVKEGVKKATILSPESLQMQKEIWLQNRELLNSVINDTSTGLGDTSKQAFSNMTDLYQSKEGILSKAKIVTKVQPSKLVQLAKKHPLITAGLEGIIGYEALKKFGAPLP